MDRSPRRLLLGGLLLTLAGCLAASIVTVETRPAAAARASQEPAQAAAPCALTWLHHEQEIEACLRECAIERLETVPIGVTQPSRAFFKPGSVVQSMAWKPLGPGIRAGYWESYKSEIAAYRLDQLLGMNMVPPAVERRVDHVLGAAIMWVDNIKGWKIDQPVRGPDKLAWDRQVVRMKMFDQLIENIDRNQGNLLYDADYHLFLIDHSRAFTGMTGLNLVSQPSRIDAEFWDKIKALTLDQLQATLGPLMGKREVAAILKRRDRMQQRIDQMVKARGAQAVFIQ